MTTRTEYIEEKKNQIDRLLAELAKLDALAREMGEEPRIRLEVQIKEFSDNLKDLQGRLDKIRESDEEVWPALKADADRSWELLSESWDETKSEFERVQGR